MNFKNPGPFPPLPAFSLLQLGLLSSERAQRWKISFFQLFLPPLLLFPPIPDANLWKSGSACSQPGIIKERDEKREESRHRRAGKIHCSMEKGGFIFLVKARLVLIKFVFSTLLMSSIVGWLLPEGIVVGMGKGGPSSWIQLIPVPATLG